MNTERQYWIQRLEAAWSIPEGFLGQVREGKYDQAKGSEFIAMLNTITLPDDESSIDRRLVSLLWYIPSFLDWQTERVAEEGGDTDALQRQTDQIRAVLENILGAP